MGFTSETELLPPKTTAFMFIADGSMPEDITGAPMPKEEPMLDVVPMLPTVAEAIKGEPMPVFITGGSILDDGGGITSIVCVLSALVEGIKRGPTPDDMTGEAISDPTVTEDITGEPMPEDSTGEDISEDDSGEAIVVPTVANESIEEPIRGLLPLGLDGTEETGEEVLAPVIRVGW